MFGYFDLCVCLSHLVRNEVWSSSIAKRIRYALSEVHKYRWVGRHKGGGQEFMLPIPASMHSTIGWVWPYNGIQHAFRRTNSLLQEQTPGASYTYLSLTLVTDADVSQRPSIWRNPYDEIHWTNL